jgi:ParB family transcriptional regulator, chromosome partitioning protein
MPTPRLVPHHMVIPPPNPLRVSMGDEHMDRLITSIKAVGILEPLLVLPRWKNAAGEWAPGGDGVTGWPLEEPDGYEIMDGHRRYTAASILKLAEIPVVVFEDAEDLKHQIMLDATTCHEEVTPFEEGLQFLELAEKYQWSMDGLMRQFGKSEDYINDRIDVVRKDQHVAEAVRDRKIGLGHAKEILKCADPGSRAMLLEQAAVHGATIAGLREMRHTFAREQAAAQGELIPNSSPQFVPGAVIPLEECIWCGQSTEPEHMVNVKVHQFHQADLKAVLDKLSLRALLGKAEGA